MDATQVTGSPTLAAGDARPGDVLAERYELLELLDADGPTLGYRALDQETERPVLVRMLAGPPLDRATLDQVVERLCGLVGVGGRYLSSLLDVDVEAGRPFTVEAWPTGTRLSAIFEARRGRGGALSPREALPVISRLVAALTAIPRPWFHGDVRAERVWVDPEGLRLTGAFLLAALPSGLRAARTPQAPAAAPELARGDASAETDRFGVAAIAWEALTSEPPRISSAPRTLAAGTLAALRRALASNPAHRPRDSEPTARRDRCPGRALGTPDRRGAPRAPHRRHRRAARDRRTCGRGRGRDAAGLLRPDHRGAPRPHRRRGARRNTGGLLRSDHRGASRQGRRFGGNAAGLFRPDHRGAPRPHRRRGARRDTGGLLRSDHRRAGRPTERERHGSPRRGPRRRRHRAARGGLERRQPRPASGPGGDGRHARQRRTLPRGPGPAARPRRARCGGDGGQLGRARRAPFGRARRPR